MFTLNSVKLAIHWFRRDLRIGDNTALTAAARRAHRVVPVFIIEDALRTGPDVGAARLAFLLKSLEALRQDLAALGYRLVVRPGRSEVEIPLLCRELKAEAVFANKRYEPYAQARDGRVFAALNEMGIGFELFKDAVVWEEREVLTQSGKPFTVFTPYARAWNARRIPAPWTRLGKAEPREPGGAPIGTEPAVFGHPLSQTLPPAGERAAATLLRRFMRGPVYEYAARRDFPAMDGTSQLSAHLRCGTIGIRTVLAALARARAAAETPAARKSCDVFLNELVWREFYLQVLHHFPHVMRGAFRPEYDGLRWSDNKDHFAAWREGRTGYPIIDAAMRCLNATGWMHNRLRMITAMFLAKDLMLPWQWGERYFMQKLVDGDLAANNGGWQWCAGTGTDAAPYFRIFNPVSQGEKFDAKGEFVRTWVPELASVSDECIHQPWKDRDTARAGGYPDRIVIHEEQRLKCLAMFKEVRTAAPRLE